MQNKPKRLTAQQIRLEQQAREMVGQRYGSFTAQETMRWACDECQRRARESFAASCKHAYKPRPKTLCWSCEYAGTSNACPWAALGDKKRPRTDWVADRADLLSVAEARRVTVESYIVLECPGYAPDRRHR